MQVCTLFVHVRRRMKQSTEGRGAIGAGRTWSATESSATTGSSMLQAAVLELNSVTVDASATTPIRTARGEANVVVTNPSARSPGQCRLHGLPATLTSGNDSDVRGEATGGRAPSALREPCGTVQSESLPVQSEPWPRCPEEQRERRPRAKALVLGARSTGRTLIKQWSNGGQRADRGASALGPSECQSQCKV